MRSLAVHHEAALPTREISALAVRVGPGGRSELLAVGDEDLAVITAELVDGRPADAGRHDLSLPLTNSTVDVRSGSDFEGVAADGEGTIFLLQEEESRLLVLAADLSRLLQVITLAVPADDPELGPAWHREPNSRGEGLLLLGRGHVLIAKQQDDACLIEFGPPGGIPGGITADTVLDAGEPFQRQDTIECELVPLAVWPLAEDTRNALPTINDLALGHDGRLYALSAEARTIVRLETRLRVGEHARATDTWQIGEGVPGGQGARPEGLTILSSGRPLVGIDRQHAGRNLVVLDPLGAP